MIGNNCEAVSILNFCKKKVLLSHDYYGIATVLTLF